MKNKLASRLPIQQMIANVISSATEKVAEDQKGRDKKVRDLLAYEKKEHGHIPTPAEEEHEEKEKMAAASAPAYVEKLAAAVEYIAGNFDTIEFPNKGLLQKAAEEAASGGSPKGAGKGPGALEVSQARGGEQNHNMGHAHNIEASKSKLHAPMSGSHEGDGATQLENDMHHAPGGGGIAPTAKYPHKGPLVAGPSAEGHHGHHHSEHSEKTAFVDQIIGGAIGYGKGKEQAARGEHHTFGGKQIASLILPGGIGYQAGRAMGHNKYREESEHGHHEHEKAASAIRQAVLRKLAGEDVMKANIEAERSANPLAGMGQLETFDANQPAPHQAGDHTGSGCGNQARRLISSNEAAINATKRDAKGPVKTELSQVLEEPALNASTDPVLNHNLQNTGKAGVKIAAQARAILEKVAQQGCTCVTIDPEGECAYCRLGTKVAAATQSRGSSKVAHDMMGGGGMAGGMMSSPTMTGGGMASMADAGAGADGCTCGGTGECRICKLKAALAAAKAGGGGAGMPNSGPPVDAGSPGAAPAGAY